MSAEQVKRVEIADSQEKSSLAGTTEDGRPKHAKCPIGGEHVEIPLRFLTLSESVRGPNGRPGSSLGGQLW